ncbi:MAG: hypothetical protein IPI12_00230 [Ignavibacteriales bacterium]|jgi:hypothetical protein|nr:hypothetical protein [Ignavibacteriales bacterium]MCC6638608.1 hypothetical protein [Ignavibacteriaceae bacterium]
MNKFSTLIVVLLVTFFATSFLVNAQDAVSLKKLGWLKGKWSRVTANVEQFETWNIISDSILSGEGYHIKSNNKKVTEKLTIKWLDKKLVYIADVPHNKKPVIFQNVVLNDTLAVFENKSHDYPNKISYLKLNKRSFRVTLDNNAGTNSRVMTFTLVTRR